MGPQVTVFFPHEHSLEHVLDGFVRAGAPRLGLPGSMLAREGSERCGSAAAAAGLEISHVSHGALFPLGEPTEWEEAAARAIQTLDGARAVGARCVYGATGPAMAMTWESAAEAFSAAIEPVVAHARASGIPLLIEPTNMVFADLGFVHTLRDAVDVARDASLGVCLDVQHCWTERGLRDTIRNASGLIGLVQVSDYIPGRREPFRAVPGDGAIPLERIIAAVLEDGYTGLIDVEIYEEEGVDPADTIARAIDRVTGMLARLGA